MMKGILTTLRRQLRDIILGLCLASLLCVGCVKIRRNSASLTGKAPFFIIGDRDNNRMLLWMGRPNKLPASPIVIGQAVSTTNVVNQGTGPTAASLSAPREPVWDGTHLIVTDTGNNRVLIWNSLPVVSGQSADFVLGQPDLTSNDINNGGTSASSMRGPNRVYSNGTQLIVGENGNNRVLIWNRFPSSNFEPADLVLGQPTMSNASANSGGVSATSLKNPFGIFSDGTNLVVCDYGNNRVLIWNSIPTANRQAADVVLGQAAMDEVTANSGGLSSKSLQSPLAALILGTKLIISDTGNNRILIWNQIPTQNFTAADLVLGQPNLISNTDNNGGVSARSLSGANGLYSSGSDLWVADAANSRVLIWDTFPTENGQAASRVLGQLDFSGSTANFEGVTSRTLANPAAIGGNLHRADTQSP